MKKGFYIGVAAGGILGLAVALSMDALLGGAIGTGWRDAMAHDLGVLFGRPFDRNSFAVLAGVAAVIGFISLFGAFAGGFFGYIIARILSLLAREG